MGEAVQGKSDVFFGIDGIMYAGPIADLVAAVVAILMARSELRRMRREESCLEGPERKTVDPEGPEQGGTVLQAAGIGDLKQDGVE